MTSWKILWTWHCCKHKRKAVPHGLCHKQSLMGAALLHNKVLRTCKQAACAWYRKRMGHDAQKPNIRASFWDSKITCGSTRYCSVNWGSPQQLHNEVKLPSGDANICSYSPTLQPILLSITCLSRNSKVDQNYRTYQWNLACQIITLLPLSLSLWVRWSFALVAWLWRSMM